MRPGSPSPSPFTTRKASDSRSNGSFSRLAIEAATAFSSQSTAGSSLPNESILTRIPERGEWSPKPSTSPSAETTRTHCPGSCDVAEDCEATAPESNHGCRLRSERSRPGFKTRSIMKRAYIGSLTNRYTGPGGPA